MTFGELLALVRREVIVDEYDDAFTDEDIYEVLWRASVETAAAFDLPRHVSIIPISEGATSIPLPVGVRRVHNVLIDGDDLRPADLTDMLRVSPGRVRPAKYFNYDPRRPDALRVAPASPAGLATVEYTAALLPPDPPGPGEAPDYEGEEVWGGVLSEFHAIVAYRAGVTLYQMDERQQEAEHWINEYQAKATELAAFLGRTDMGSVLVQRELRNDEGAAS